MTAGWELEKLSIPSMLIHDENASPPMSVCRSPLLYWTCTRETSVDSASRLRVSALTGIDHAKELTKSSTASSTVSVLCAADSAPKLAVISAKPAPTACTRVALVEVR